MRGCGSASVRVCDGFADRVRVNGDDGLDVRGVAATHDDDGRDVAVAERVKYKAIAGAQAVDCQLQTSKSIAFVRVGAREIEDDIGPPPIEDPGQMLAHRGEILVVSRAVREGDVEVA